MLQNIYVTDDHTWLNRYRISMSQMTTLGLTVTALQNIYVTDDHTWFNRYRISMSQMTTYMFLLF